MTCTSMGRLLRGRRVGRTKAPYTGIPLPSGGSPRPRRHGRGQEVQVFAHAFTDEGIEFEVTWWTGSRPVDVRRSRDEVVAAVKQALDEAGLRVAVPRRVLAFDP